MVKLGNDWDEILSDEFKKTYYLELREFLKEEYRNKTIYPNMNNIFEVLKHTSYKDTKVLILGQDPYHGENQANGLSFSVTETTKIPPSLRNIFTELVSDIKCDYPPSGDLTKWAKEGVLLLNSILSVGAGKPMSHASMGWELFTDYILSCLNEKDYPIVFILWGNHARSKKRLINQQKHLVLESVHPSPLSAHRGFFGSCPFSKANAFLVSKGIHPIDWSLTK